MSRNHKRRDFGYELLALKCSRRTNSDYTGDWIVTRDDVGIPWHMARKIFIRRTAYEIHNNFTDHQFMIARTLDYANPYNESGAIKKPSKFGPYVVLEKRSGIAMLTAEEGHIKMPITIRTFYKKMNDMMDEYGYNAILDFINQAKAEIKDNPQFFIRLPATPLIKGVDRTYHKKRK